MVLHYNPTFLDDRAEYGRAVQFWIDLWERVNPYKRQIRGWKHPWVGTGSPDIMDGNPIFSAHTPEFKKGIRVIQYPPTSNKVELQYWLDTFGGPITDPEALRELVIACALSDEAASQAFTLMQAWVLGEEISITYKGNKEFSYPVIEPFTAVMNEPLQVA